MFHASKELTLPEETTMNGEEFAINQDTLLSKKIHSLKKIKRNIIS
jgi:hypothetical protein